MKKTILALCALAGAASALPSVDKILTEIDENQRMGRDVKARVVMTQKKAEQGTKVLDMMYYRRDSDNSFLITMTAPEAEKGNGYLRVGDNFWMYRKNTRTFQHVNRDESIGGSDASGEDFETRRLTELYKASVDDNGREKVGEEMLGKIPVYKVEVVAKMHDVSYPTKIYWVRKDNFLPLKEQGFAGSGTLMMTTYYLNYTKIGGRYVPVKQLYVDEFEKGNKTIVEISGISLEDVDDQVFTKAYLENLSK
jgi:outer membrane lipoprotein-sorting protein